MTRPVAAMVALVTVLVAAGARADDPACARTEECIDDGRCSLVDGECKHAREEDCRRSEACREEGMCSWDGMKDECVVANDESCMRSSNCAEDGQCWFDSDEQECFEGTARASTGTMIAGAVIAGAGGLLGIAGLIVMLSGVSFHGSGDPQRFMTGGILAGTGFGAALLIGVPMAIIGATWKERVRGYDTTATVTTLKVTPGSAALEVRF